MPVTTMRQFAVTGSAPRPTRSNRLPFADLMFRVQSVHRANFDPNYVETASLLSVKTGSCPEDCGYCSQSAHYDTGLKAIRLMDGGDVLLAARRAKDAGAPRSCMATPGVVRRIAISIGYMSYDQRG